MVGGEESNRIRLDLEEWSCRFLLFILFFLFIFTVSYPHIHMLDFWSLATSLTSSEQRHILSRVYRSPINPRCVVQCALRNRLNVTLRSPPSHVVEVGGGPVSKATEVSFFASGPFPTCYQMSRSSTAEASKSSSLGAATGATNVRKPNTAARAGRFQLQPRRQMERLSSCLGA